MQVIKKIKRKVSYVKYHIKLILGILFRLKQNNAYLFGAPMHINMGDQAQTYCIRRWINNNYEGYNVIILPIPHTTNFVLKLIKVLLKSSDKIFFHSGYHLTDLYPVKDIYFRCLSLFKEHQIVSFPQTVYFENEKNLLETSCIFSKHPNMVLLCRDETSYQTAKNFFKLKKIFLFPDIVTTLIGSYSFNNKRNGVLFCLRNDIEAYYSAKDLDILIGRFGNIRKERTDTSIPNSFNYIETNRKKILENIFNYYSTFKVVITDRYHGTIFSLIAQTPVIVLSSTDHKLSSGVKWFPKEIFGDYVFYASSLDEAYEVAKKKLIDNSLTYKLPKYFEENYYCKLKEKLEE